MKDPRFRTLDAGDDGVVFVIKLDYSAAGEVEYVD